MSGVFLLRTESEALSVAVWRVVDARGHHTSDITRCCWCGSVFGAGRPLIGLVVADAGWQGAAANGVDADTLAQDAQADSLSVVATGTEPDMTVMLTMLGFAAAALLSGGSSASCVVS